MGNGMSCNGELLIFGPLFALVGAFTFCLGIAAWRYPNSNFIKNMLVRGYAPEETAGPISRFLGWTRENSGPVNLRVFRIVGPFVGSMFFGIGIWTTVVQLQCRAKLPDFRALIGPLEWQFWPPMILFVIIVLISGLADSWRVRLLPRSILILLFVCWSISGGEAAAFHTGMQANRWFALVIIITPILYVAEVICKKYFSVAQPETKSD